jgi:hypothetical protein
MAKTKTETATLNIQAINSTIHVARTIGKAKSAEELNAGEEEIIAVHKFLTTPAEVEVTMALTMNLGNYESARISASVRIPCYKEEIAETYLLAERFVQERIETERNQIAAVKDPGKKSNNPF